MSITDELRKWMRSHTVNCSDNRIALVAIADSIDREHRMALEKVAAEVDALPMTDESMAEHGWIRLPKDADGEYIHVGDVMEWCDSGETLTVEGIGRDVLFYIDGENAEWTAARNKRHHHAPTVEDVLREFANAVLGCDNTEESVQRVIAEYAAKLRLAEEVDE